MSVTRPSRSRQLLGLLTVAMRVFLAYEAAELAQQQRMPLVAALIGAYGLASLAGLVSTRLELRWAWPRGVWMVGDEQWLRLHVTNATRRASAPVVVRLAGAGFPEVVLPVPALAPGESTTVVAPLVPTQRRPETALTQRSLIQNRLLGRARGVRPGAAPVLPAVRPRPDLPPAYLLRQLAQPAEEGHGTGHRGRVDPLQVRHFVSGDAVSSVHWRSTARAGTPVVMEREQPASGTVVLLVCGTPAQGLLTADTGAADPWEQTVARAAGLVQAAQDQGTPVSVVAAASGEALPIAPTHGLVQDWLAGLGESGPAQPALVEEAVRRARGGLVAVLSQQPWLAAEVGAALTTGVVLDLAQPW